MASTLEKPEEHSTDAESSVEERWALIERVAASEQFSRSVRLRDFLLYVGRQSLKEGCPEIHEQEIGARVFGRPASYDRGSDNIVRVNATELRKRIEAHFRSTGAAESLIFEIPRGAYRLVFHRRAPGQADASLPPHPAPETAPSTETAPATSPWRSPWLRRISRIVWPVLALALALVCLALYLDNRAMEKALHPWDTQPALADFWGGFLDAHRQTDLVLPDDSASVMEDITGKPLTLGDYMSRGFIQQIQSSDMSADRKQDVYQVLNHNLVTFGAVRAAQALAAEIPATYPHYLTLARYFTADQIKRDNVVFIGGKKAIPWDDLFDDQLNFVTDYDYQHASQIVRNRKPGPGEQPVYTVPLNADSLIGYAVVAYLPNPSQSGKVVILAGTDSDATGGAAAFLTSEDQMARLRNTFHAGRFPYFEALLKTSRLSGTFFDAEVVAFRTYPNLH
ncbi:MAG TPA: hypothetical protein VHX37_15680 [Acidobacteriaceae bacterium]|jgi:hypothetical protein|nr:hypothetical protein [Acidobacteriaceae bacterium]